MSDEQFHEFHLDGKQMVFLFMASTVVAVVIFLCGVMVGRGVQAKRLEPMPSEVAGQDIAPAGESIEPEAESSPDPDFPDKFSYSQRLRSESPLDERIRDVAPAATRGESEAPAIPDEAPAPKPEARQESLATQTTKRSTDGLGEPAGPGYAVQVASLPKLSKAQSMRNDLIAKKYPAFIVPPTAGSPTYRVRVGKYRTEKEAKAVERRLEREENFRDAWIPR